MKACALAALVLFLLIGLTPPLGPAVGPRAAGPRTIPAASCSQQDVQAAIDKAAEGDTVSVPAGAATWRSPGSARNALIIARPLTLAGAGVGKTVITDGGGAGWNENAVRIDVARNKLVRITGFTIVGAPPSSAFAFFTFRGPYKSYFRVDHCRFESMTRRPISVDGSYGVIDHCEVIDGGLQIQPMGDEETWNRPLDLGTSDAVIVEDCLFRNGDARHERNCIDGHQNARYVFRFNRVEGAYVETHGFCCRLTRGAFSLEVYNNVLDGFGETHYRPFSLRGGTGVLFANRVEGYESPYIHLYNDRSCDDKTGGLCDGKNKLDGNEDPSGYPCRDQIGRSTTLPDGRQSLEPMYEWDNLREGDDVDIILNPSWCAAQRKHLKEYRDFFNDTPRPGYVPFRYPHPLTLDGAKGRSLDLRTEVSPSRRAKLAWSAVDGAKDYRVQRDWGKAVVVTGTEFAQDNLSAGGVYTYIVEARDKSGKVLAMEGVLVKAGTGS